MTGILLWWKCRGRYDFSFYLPLFNPSGTGLSRKKAKALKPHKQKKAESEAVTATSAGSSQGATEPIKRIMVHGAVAKRGGKGIKRKATKGDFQKDS